MTSAELLAHLADQGAYLSVHDGRLRYYGRASILTPETREALQERKEELLDLLGRERFTREELDALGFAGTPCTDGSGLWEVRSSSEDRQ